MCQKLPMIMNPCGGGGAGGLVALLIYGVRAGRIGRGEEPGPFGIKNPAATVYGAVLFGDPAAAQDRAGLLLGHPAAAQDDADVLLGRAPAAQDRAGVLLGDPAAAQDDADVLLGRAPAAHDRAGR